MSQVTRPVFLLSPAYCGGRRGQALLRDGASGTMAERLQQGRLTLGEAFSFMSGLYFRGKLAYATAFGTPETTYVITPTQGLAAPATPASRDMLREFAAVDIADGGDRYLTPLARDCAVVEAAIDPGAVVVLLGSIATGKYADALAPVFGRRLHYPVAFIGRGDMSRGGLLLRSAAAGVELEYLPFTSDSARRGPRPPKLEPIARRVIAGA